MNQDKIQRYLTCVDCALEKPPNLSNEKYGRLSIGLTETGMQVWCTRHRKEVAHILPEDLRKLIAAPPSCECPHHGQRSNTAEQTIEGLLHGLEPDVRPDTDLDDFRGMLVERLVREHESGAPGGLADRLVSAIDRTASYLRVRHFEYYLSGVLASEKGELVEAFDRISAFAEVLSVDSRPTPPAVIAEALLWVMRGKRAVRVMENEKDPLGRVVLDDDPHGDIVSAMLAEKVGLETTLLRLRLSVEKLRAEKHTLERAADAGAPET